MTPLHISNEEFRSLANRVTSIAADFLEDLNTMRAYPRTSGACTTETFEAPLSEEGLQHQALDALASVIDMSRPPTARFFGYVLGSGEPIAALADLLASILNQNVTAWRSAPAATAIENQVVRWIAAALECESFTGSFCSGGSAANLMALAMAREKHAPANDSGAAPGIVYVSSEAHMSMAKAVALLGLGRNNMRIIPVDAQFRMCVAELRRSIEQDRAAGRKLIAVVASAGTVNTGAIDPLEQIATICREHALWLHVDGAYGAPAALAVPAQFRGLNEADSLSIDLHKWLYQPVDCGMLLYKDRSLAQVTFSHTGEYARVLDSEGPEGFAYFDHSMELSRRFRALKTWLSMRYHGLRAFRAAIHADLIHAKQLASLVSACPQLELLAPVELSAVCFRYRASDDQRSLNELNAAILRRVIDNGRIYLSNASIRGNFALRACFVNHRTEETDVAQIVPEVMAAARSILTKL